PWKQAWASTRQVRPCPCGALPDHSTLGTGGGSPKMMLQRSKTGFRRLAASALRTSSIATRKTTSSLGSVGDLATTVGRTSRRGIGGLPSPWITTSVGFATNQNHLEVVFRALVSEFFRATACPLRVLLRR